VTRHDSQGRFYPEKSGRGVTGVKTDYRDHTATVTFDDEKITLEEMRDALRRENYPVEGDPEFLSPSPNS